MSESNVTHIAFNGPVITLCATKPACAGVRLTARRYVYFAEYPPSDDLVQFEIELWTPDAQAVTYGECMVRILRDLENDFQNVIGGYTEELSFATEEGALTLLLSVQHDTILVGATLSHPYGSWDSASAEMLLRQLPNTTPVRLEAAFVTDAASVANAVRDLRGLLAAVPDRS